MYVYILTYIMLTFLFYLSISLYYLFFFFFFFFFFSFFSFFFSFFFFLFFFLSSFFSSSFCFSLPFFFFFFFLFIYLFFDILTFFLLYILDNLIGLLIYGFLKKKVEPNLKTRNSSKPLVDDRDLNAVWMQGSTTAWAHASTLVAQVLKTSTTTLHNFPMHIQQATVVGDCHHFITPSLF